MTDNLLFVGMPNHELQVHKLQLIQNSDSGAKNTPKRFDSNSASKANQNGHPSYYQRGGVNVQDLLNRQSNLQVANVFDNKNMILYAPSISDSQRMTKINIDWLKEYN